MGISFDQTGAFPSFIFRSKACLRFILLFITLQDLDGRPSVMQDENSMPDASPDPTSDTPPKKHPFRLRYSLRSLLIFMLLFSASLALRDGCSPWLV